MLETVNKSEKARGPWWQSAKVQQFLKTFGPGIMFAGTCIGGSHLVQSTKAGAYYGFGLLAIILLANLFKYPFLEFASRYTNATGDSIIEGYRRQGKWTLWLYLAITLVSMFIVTAAIGTVTGGLAKNLLGIDALPGYAWTGMSFLVVFGLVAYGKFGVLDKSLKVIGLLLVVTVCTAVAMVVMNKPAPTGYPNSLEVISTPAGLAFTIALMGWMPIGIDMSAWHSLWTQERIKQTGYHPTLKETLLDFNIGYGITVVLAVFFTVLGAYTIYGTGVDIQGLSAVGYAGMLVDMFAGAVGEWSRWVIAIAAFATMFGTCITLVDGYTRSVERTVALLKSDEVEEKPVSKKGNYLMWMLVLIGGSFIICLFFVTNLGQIMNLATGLSFLIAPLAAFLNFKIVYSPEVKEEFRPSKGLKGLAFAGMAFLTVFTGIYLWQLML